MPMNGTTAGYSEMKADASAPPSRWQRIRRFLEIASNVGEIVMSLRDKPTARDWLGLGLRTLNLADRIRAEVQSAREYQAPGQFFDADRWRALPIALSSLIVQHAKGRRLPDWPHPNAQGVLRPVTADFDGLKVGWLAGDDWATVEPEAHERFSSWAAIDVDVDDLYRRIGERLWAAIGTRHLHYAGDHVLPGADDEDVVAYVEPEQMRVVRERLRAFVDAGIGRGVLFVGPPGAGKSRAARALTAAMGLRSIRMDVGVFEHAVPSGSETLSLRECLRVYRPDVLVIDDVDRVRRGTQLQLLHVIEDAMVHCRLVICTINCPDLVPGALMRPGRIDDVVVFEPPDRATVEGLLGPELCDLAPMLDGLPITYVVEFAKRCRALGRELALGEIGILKRQAADVERRTKREDVWEDAA